MERQIQCLHDHVILCGFGRMGRPDAHVVIGDRLVAIGRREQLAELSRLCGVEGP